MLYGYFFTDDKPEALRKAASYLALKKFDFVEIFQDSTKIYWLHLQRREIHNTESLFELDKYLYDVANKYGLRSYDGFDVGNVDDTKPIDRDTYAVPEDFKVAEIIIAGYPMLVMENTAFDRFPHKEEFCYFIKVDCAYKSIYDSMLPSEDDMEKFEVFDSTIQGQLGKAGIKNYYIGRETYKEKRSCYIVTNKEEATKKIMKEIKQSKNILPFEFEVIVDKPWKQYLEMSKKLKN